MTTQNPTTLHGRPTPESESASEPVEAKTGLSRRAVLRGSAALAAAAASGQGADAHQVTQTAGTSTSDPLNFSVYLVNRATFGFTQDALDEVRTRGHEGWLDWQLDHLAIDDSAVEARVAAFDWVGQTIPQMAAHPTKEEWDIGHEARAIRVLRATFSRRQVFERVVEFWTDHFNVYGSADDTWLLKIVDDAKVIRTHALGTFRDLLQASAASPAMVAYLDNDTNVVGAAQENYAREVMELHTLGSDGPYTEDDVRELARCFTGWNYVKPLVDPPRYGEFEFIAADHDTGAKTVLGLPIAAGGGMDDAMQVLDLLADHPKTIDYVTTKMARWFLGYEPPQSAIDAAKATWVSTGGNIKEIVRTLLSPASIRAAEPWRNRKLKRPMHWMISLYRATGVDLPRPTDTVWQTWALGQPPFQWPAPNGYPDSEGAWAALLMPRWEQAAYFGSGNYWSTDHNIGYLRALLGTTIQDDWAAKISEVLSGSTMSLRDVRLLQGYIDSYSSPSNKAVAEAFELAASSPSFGRY